MKPVTDAVCLRIVGFWNPAIVTPNWIAREALGKAPNDEFQVNVQLPIGPGGNSLGGLAQRFTFEGLSLAVSFDALHFYLGGGSDAEAALAFSTAVKTMKALSHTPVHALGINFGYLVDAPNEMGISSFERIDAAAEQVDEENVKVVQRSWSAVLKMKTHLLNVTCQRNGEVVQFDFNHHFEVSSSGKAVALLEQQGLFASLRTLSENFVKKYEEAEA